MNVAGLFIYPIKAGPAVAIEQAEVGPRGFVGDRRFMVVNAAGQFLTQRNQPALGRVAVHLDGPGLLLEADGIGRLAVRVPHDGDLLPVQVWSDRVEALSAGTEADEFYSALLGEAARLVYMPDSCDRPTDDHPDIPLSFADGFPYLIATTASLEDLNSRIPGAPVPMAAFRPNIVLDGATAWAEDEWDLVIMGSAILRCTTNCERCSVTTLDPTGPDRPRPDGEPLRTLARFRRNARGKVDFARNAVAAQEGTISVGQPARATVA